MRVSGYATGIFALGRRTWFKLILAGVGFAILLAGGLLRSGANDFGRSVIIGDETTYKHAAHALLDCGTLIKDVDGARLAAGSCDATPGLSPGYPVFLAAIYSVFDRSDAAVISANLWLSLLVVVGVAMATYAFSQSAPAALMSMALAALYPSLIYNVDRLLTEQLFCALFIWSMWGIARWLTCRNLLALMVGSVCIFAACHVRAQAAPLAVLLFLFVVFASVSKRDSLVASALFLSVGALMFLPWAARNFIQFQQFIPLTTAGEGPRIWGAVPYYLDMAWTNNRGLEAVESVNSVADEGVYWRWRTLGYTNLMLGDVWDERTVHLPWWTQKLLWTHWVALAGLMLSPALLWRCLKPVMWLPVLAAVLLFWCGMPYHGLPRYALPILILGLCLAPIVLFRFGIAIANKYGWSIGS